MRKKIEMLRKQTVFNKQMQERQHEIEKEKLKVLRENRMLKKSKSEYYKLNHLEYKDILNNIDENLRDLKNEVEKLGPSYLT